MRKSRLQQAPGFPQVRSLPLVQISLYEEELKALFEEEAVIVAYENDPVGLCTFDEERDALKAGLCELREVLFQRNEVAAAGNGNQSIVLQSESVDEKLFEDRLEAVIAAMKYKGLGVLITPNARARVKFGLLHQAYLRHRPRRRIPPNHVAFFNDSTSLKTTVQTQTRPR